MKGKIMINLEKLDERKQVIAKDIEAVRARMGEAQKKFAEDQSLLQALMGAFQQCDAFAKEFNDDTPNEESDVENSFAEEDLKPGGTD